jgi:hypothetical protein
MASLRVLAIDVASVFLGAALLAPPLYGLAQARGGFFQNLWLASLVLGLTLAIWIVRDAGQQKERA